MKRGVKYFFMVLFSLALVAGKNEKAFSQEADYKAYTLFLYNFMKYIEWPDANGDFVVGVMGASPVYYELQALSESKKAKGRKIVVKVIESPEEAAHCSMVFLPSAKSSQLRMVSEKVKGKSILIVAEREGLARKGAGISFAIDENDGLKFDINKSVLDARSLKIANVLLELGILVG